MKNLSSAKLFKLLIVALTAACVSLPSTGLTAPTVLDTAFNPASGHTYHLLSNSDWTNAEIAAVGLGGHLATINDLAENNWIWDHWGTNRTLWIGLKDPVFGDGGGFQHAANFAWVSGDVSAYRNWNSGEPNGDNFTYIMAKGFSIDGKWNDTTSSTGNLGEPPFYGVVEIGVCTPHHAMATATLVSGFVVGATITDPGCGYINAPQVLIQGGGGSGATATANITNGMVTAINIISAGSGYTSLPQIIVASPPFLPSVNIGVSKVKVLQNVMLGKTYILEASTNLINWTVTGPAFTATNENMVSEFDVDTTGRYFRLQQVQ